MPAVSALPEGLELEPAKMKVAGVNILPIVAKLFSLLPAKARRKAVSKQNAPSPDPAELPRDLSQRNLAISRCHSISQRTDQPRR